MAVSVCPEWLESVAGEEMKEAEEWRGRAVARVVVGGTLCRAVSPGRHQTPRVSYPVTERGEGWGALYRSDFYPVESVRGAWSWS